MMGIPHDSELKGIIPRTFSSVFDLIAKTSVHREFDIKVSMFQIYMEKIEDLLDHKDNLKIRESKISGIYVEGLTEVPAKSEEELFQIMEFGKKNSMIRVTHMSMSSSRIHSLFMLSVTSKNIETESERKSKLFLVDLAGSERMTKTGMQANLTESHKINMSLTAMRNVICALTEPK